MRGVVAFVAVGIVGSVAIALAACSEAPGEYCDTPGICTLPDGAVPDVKKDAPDAAPDTATVDVAAQ